MEKAYAKLHGCYEVYNSFKIKEIYSNIFFFLHKLRILLILKWLMDWLI